MSAVKPVLMSVLLVLVWTAVVHAQSQLKADRPFDVVEMQLGDKTLAIPREWLNVLRIVDERRPFIIAHNVNQRRPPRTPYFEFPPLSLFGIRTVSANLVEQNLKDQREEFERRQDTRQPDNNGFWNWKPQRYVLVDQTYARPLNQRLVVQCSPSLRPDQKKGEQRCRVHFYWTQNTLVTYDFSDTDVPKGEWSNLDREVLSLLRFLDAREPLSAFPSSK